ncbi:hypothetical protein Dimus_027249 [Dionaea muscipula]
MVPRLSHQTCGYPLCRNHFFSASFLLDIMDHSKERSTIRVRLLPSIANHHSTIELGIAQRAAIHRNLLLFAMLTWRRPGLVSGLSLRIHQRHHLVMVALQLLGSSLYHSFPNLKMKFATLCFSVRVLSF